MSACNGTVDTENVSYLLGYHRAAFCVLLCQCCNLWMKVIVVLGNYLFRMIGCSIGQVMAFFQAVC